MLISTTVIPCKSEFEDLLSLMMKHLEEEANKNSAILVKYSSLEIEELAFKILSHCAIGTPFENTIEWISGQSFPDIIACGYYGLEVKTTKANHWKSTGSSVAEGTRIYGIERIYMLFGKLCNPVEFACKPYEDCLSGVVVTHSPRYTIYSWRAGSNSMGSSLIQCTQNYI